MKRKIPSLLLSLALVLALGTSAFAVAFTDLPESKWYYTEVSEMIAQGYINGYPDGSFQGENAMTLAEFTTILARISGIPCGSQDGFWGGMQMAAARERGWLNDGDLLLAGYNDAIPRQLAAKLLVCALELKPSAEITALPFLDAADIDGAYLSYVTTAYVSGLFQGDSDGNFYPEGSVTRGAGATLIYRAVHLGEEPSEEEPPEESGGITYEGYTAQQVKDHFITCALGAEYGDSTPVVKKWTEPLYYAYAGTPMEGDVEYLESFMAALNGIEGFPGIYPAGEHTPNLTIHFVNDEAAMEAATGHTNLNGYASIWWYNGSYQIYQGDVYYLGTMPDYERKSVLIEELYQVMGILNDTYSYPESLIYQYYTEADWPCALDWAIMQLLYHPDIRSGMSEDQCVEVIDKLL